MKLKLLKDYKVIFVDFDNTICLHKNTLDYTEPEGLFADYGVNQQLIKY